MCDVRIGVCGIHQRRGIIRGVKVNQKERPLLVVSSPDIHNPNVYGSMIHVVRIMSKATSDFSIPVVVWNYSTKMYNISYIQPFDVYSLQREDYQSGYLSSICPEDVFQLVMECVGMIHRDITPQEFERVADMVHDYRVRFMDANNVESIEYPYKTGYNRVVYKDGRRELVAQNPEDAHNKKPAIIPHSNDDKNVNAYASREERDYSGGLTTSLGDVLKGITLLPGSGNSEEESPEEEVNSDDNAADDADPAPADKTPKEKRPSKLKFPKFELSKTGLVIMARQSDSTLLKFMELVNNEQVAKTTIQHYYGIKSSASLDHRIKSAQNEIEKRNLSVGGGAK